MIQILGVSGLRFSCKLPKKMIRLVVLKNSIACVTMVVTICFVLVLLLTMLKLPEVSTRKRGIGSDLIIFKTRKVPNDDRLGKFGEMMIEMLPRDLAFTVFVPSEKAFSRDLGLRVNDSLNDTYAMVSRILGFSAVPRPLSSVNVPFGVEHLLRDVKDTTISTLATEVNAKLTALKGLDARLRDIKIYIDLVVDGKLPLNRCVQSTTNLNVPDLIKAFAEK